MHSEVENQSRSKILSKLPQKMQCKLSLRSIFDYYRVSSMSFIS